MADNLQEAKDLLAALKGQTIGGWSIDLYRMLVAMVAEVERLRTAAQADREDFERLRAAYLDATHRDGAL